MNKSISYKIIAAMTAFIAAVSLTGCSENDDITISKKDDSSAATDVTTEAVTETVSEVTSAAETKKTEPAETTEKKDTEKSEKKDTEKQGDEEYKNELLDFFTENVSLYNDGFAMSNDFGMKCDFDADDLIWIDASTKEILFSGGKELKSYESDKIDYSAHPDAHIAYPLNDSRFSDIDEYTAFLKNIFSEKFLEAENCGRKRFTEYNGKTYITEISKGLLFEKWDTDKAEITEFEKDKSFTVFVPGFASDNPQDALYGTLKFINERGGWKIDDIGYDNITNDRFSE